MRMIIAVAVALAFHLPVATAAQDYPVRTIRVVVPSAAGGSLDLVARLFAEFVAPRLRQPVIVENKPGAETLIGTQFVARAAPDGYTLLFASPNSSFAAVIKEPGVAVANDFEFVSMVMRAPELLAVNAAHPFRAIGDLAAYARTNPGKLNYASYGKTLWLLTGILNRKVGIDAVHVGYSNAGQATQAVAAGEVDYILSGLTTLASHIERGRVRVLLVTTAERSPLFPGVPGMRESGIESEDLTVWFGLMAPRGTPQSVVTRLNAEVAAFAQEPATVRKFREIGFEPYPTSPQEFRRHFLAEERAMQETARALGIEPQ